MKVCPYCGVGLGVQTCLKCGVEIPKGARFCPKGCGAVSPGDAPAATITPQTPPMTSPASGRPRTMLFVVLGVAAIVALVVVLAVWSYIANKREDEMACALAQGKNNTEQWRVYKAQFPDGVCREEAKSALHDEVCASAKAAQSVEQWNEYLGIYPDGGCKKNAVKLFDEIACKAAREANTKASWEAYLQRFPNGSCKRVAGKIIDAIENHPDLIEKYGSGYRSGGWWVKENVVIGVSSGRWWQRWPPKKEIDWYSAKRYCNNLSLAGHSDWKLPSISQLKTVVSGCSKIVNCKVTDSCRSKSCDNGDPCNGCDYNKGPGKGGWYLSGVFATMKDPNGWSSSLVEDTESDVWVVSFTDGSVYDYNTNYSRSVRCVRDAP